MPMIPAAAVSENPAMTRRGTLVPVRRMWSRSEKMPSAKQNARPVKTAAIAPDTA